MNDVEDRPVDIVDVLARVVETVALDDDQARAFASGAARSVRRSHQLRLGGATTVLVAAGAVAFAVVSTSTTTPASRDRVNVSPISSPPAETRASTTSTTPRYLPDGAQLVASTQSPPGTGSSSFSLPGKVNARTIPATGLTEQNVDTVHPATFINVSFTSLVPEPDLSYLDNPYSTVEKITVGGWPAQITTPKNGYGTIRIDWTDGAGYHVVGVDRLKTIEGTSGVDAPTLIRIANSLYDGSHS